ncbi:hypothetical protein UlMin_005482 [Ulmus minor]
MEVLPPGFRFFPTEEELILFYLHNKLDGRREDLNQVMNRVIPVLDIYEFDPSDLPQFAGELCREDPEQWFFFIPRQESEARGGRPSRLTETGYWKATGSPSYVYSSNNRIIGQKRTMVFYIGRAPTGNKTQWKINEYKAIEGEASSTATPPPLLRHEWSLCRVYKKSKCLRAFDRRPIRAEHINLNPTTSNIQQAPQGGHNLQQEGSTSGRNPSNLPPPPPAVVERTSSHDDTSSSSGDQGGQPSQSNQSGNFNSQNMVVNFDNMALWDWSDQFFK